MNRIKCVLFTACCFLVCAFSVSAEEGEALTPYEKYLMRARRDHSNGKLDPAIEGYRKVLFVDQFNFTASVNLARALEEKGRTKKALEEYEFSLTALERDDSVSAKEKRSRKARIKQKISDLRGRVKDKRLFGPFGLSFWEVNLLVLSFLIAVFFVFETVNGLFSWFGHVARVKKESKLWRDRYWERRKERDIHRFGIPLVPVCMHLLLAAILIYGIYIVVIKGLRNCLDSLVFPFYNLFS